LELERQRHEHEDRLRESVRKLRQSVFDFSEALPNLRKAIEELLPDYYCAVALFLEMDLQRQADALHSNRELLESYEDKKLLKNCSDMVTSIRACVEECASTDGSSFDQIARTLGSRRSEIGQWRQLLANAREQLEKLSRSIADWDGTGPNEFLNACEHLRTTVAETPAAIHSLGQSLQRFEETFGFVCGHPNICQIWPDACEARPKMAEEIFSRGKELFDRANQLFHKWMDQVPEFGVLMVSFSESRYEDFLEKVEQCSPDLRNLPEVRRWEDTASTRLQKASKLLQAAKDEIARRNWRSARAKLREVRNVPCSQRLNPELGKLEADVSHGLLPARLFLAVISAIVLGILLYWLGIASMHHSTIEQHGATSPVSAVSLKTPATRKLVATEMNSRSEDRIHVEVSEIPVPTYIETMPGVDFGRFAGNESQACEFFLHHKAAPDAPDQSYTLKEFGFERLEERDGNGLSFTCPLD